MSFTSSRSNASVSAPNPGMTRAKRAENFSENEGPEGSPQTKRPRSADDARAPLPESLPKWLRRQRDFRTSQQSFRANVVGNTSHTPLSYEQTNPLPERCSGNHARIYIGNLPCQLGLPNAAYRQVFTALYVTAFGTLKPGEVSPIQSCWLHTCKKYGFLQMRGSKEAVNVLLFNGLVLHGRTIKVSRPTGYRPEMKDLSAEEYVPDRVDGDRMKILIKALCGIIAEPREKTYLVAIQQPSIESKKEEETELSTSGSDVAPVNRAEYDKKTDPVEKDAMGASESRSESDEAGTVVALVDMLKSFNLEDKDVYEEILVDVREECSRFGEVESVVIPKEGDWAGTTFVQFPKPIHARQAVKGMSKRGFEGKKIKAYIVEDCETAKEASKRTRRTGPSL